MRRWSTAVSPRSSTDCMHNRKIVLGFAKHIRENMGTFAQLFPAFSQNSATFSAFFPLFSPLDRFGARNSRRAYPSCAVFSALHPMRFGVVVVFSPPADNSSGHRPLLPSVKRGFLCLPHGTKAENDNFETHSHRIHPARYIFSFILIAHRQKSSTFATY